MTKQRSLLLFESSIKSAETRKQYLYYLEKFKKFCKLKDYDSIPTIDSGKLREMIEDYVMFLRKKMGPNSIPPYVHALQSFFEINDVDFNWKRVKRLLPAKIKLTGNQAWSTDAIKRMLEFCPDLRARALIHFLSSSGIRIGAIPDLKLKHVAEMPHGCKSALAYEDTREEYFTFLTPEASKALDLYLEQRRKDGESVKPESPVFRIHYQLGLAIPKSLSVASVENIIRRIVHKSGQRKEKKGYRFSVQQNHGFRKRFNTILKLNQDVNSNIAEKLMGHKNGLDGVYLTPTKEQLFEEFRKAIPDLTIDSSERLRARNRQLEKDKSELEKKNEEKQMLEDRIARQEQSTKNILEKLDHMEKKASLQK